VITLHGRKAAREPFAFLTCLAISLLGGTCGDILLLPEEIIVHSSFCLGIEHSAGRSARNTVTGTIAVRIVSCNSLPWTRCRIWRLAGQMRRKRGRYTREHL
jgi:hypothetical protein